MTGIVALYIFMLAAFTGYEVIATRAGDPAHAADVGLELRARHRAGRRHGGARAARTRTLEKTIGFVGVLLAAGNAVGGYVGHRAHARDVQVQRRAQAAPRGGH